LTGYPEDGDALSKHAIVSKNKENDERTNIIIGNRERERERERKFISMEKNPFMDVLPRETGSNVYRQRV